MSLLQQGELIHKLAARRASGLRPMVLLTDIDRTYILEEGKTEVERRRYWPDTHRLTSYLATASIPAVAVTSNAVQSLWRDHQRGLLPVFDAALLSLGAERYAAVGGRYVADQEYRTWIERRGADRRMVYGACQQWFDYVEGSLPRQAWRDLGLTFQPRDRPDNLVRYEGGAKMDEAVVPQPYKISFNFYGDVRTARQVEVGLREFLTGAGFGDLAVLVTYDRPAGARSRYNIDVLWVRKAAAVERLIEEIGEAQSDVLWVYAGDSRNDEDALHRAGDAAIVVGGYRNDLDLTPFGTFRPGAVNRLRQEGRERLVYIEEHDGLKGPASLLRGLRAIERAVALAQIAGT